MKPLAENVHLTPMGDALEIVDQTLLPAEKRLITLKSREELYNAIYTLQVRGAPAIGIFAGYALYVLAQQINAPDFPEFYRQLSQEAGYLESSRPTAVNLSWALRRMLNCAKSQSPASREALLEALLREATAIQQEDIACLLYTSPSPRDS